MPSERNGCAVAGCPNFTHSSIDGKRFCDEHYWPRGQELIAVLTASLRKP